MKILKSVQDNFAVLGMNLDRKTLQHPFDFRKRIVVFVFGTAIILSYVSISRARTFKEYTDSIHMTLTLSLGSLIYGILLFETTKIAELIGNFERILDDSEWTFK